jgi:ribonuclease HI
MINQNDNRQSNQALKKQFRRTGPLDAYIYQDRSDDSNIEDTHKNIFVHLPEPIEQKPKILHIFTDGACTNNGKRNANAAWGVILVSDIGYIVLDRYSGAVPKSEPQTNQRAELRALLRGVEIAENQCRLDRELRNIQIWSDSQYSIKCASVWGPNWKKAGWKKQGGPIQHLDLIQPLVLATQRLGMSLEFKWLKGHKGGDAQHQFPWVFNHQVDELATMALA